MSRRTSALSGASPRSLAIAVALMVALPLSAALPDTPAWAGPAGEDGESAHARADARPLVAPLPSLILRRAARTAGAEEAGPQASGPQMPVVDPLGATPVPDRTVAWEAKRAHLEALVDVFGFDFGTTLTDEDLLRAAERLAVSVTAPLSLDDAESLLAAHRQSASNVIRSLGFDHGTTVTNEDLLRAADRLGLEVGVFADPYNVQQIIRAGSRQASTPRIVLASRTAAPLWDSKRRHLEALVDVLGFDVGTTLTDEDLLRAAEKLGLRMAAPVNLDDAEALLRAHRQTASRAIRSLGFDHGTTVTNEDLLRAGRALGVNVGVFADPYNVQQIIRGAEVRRQRNARTPVFASVEGVRIHVPSRHVRLVGFHQAAYTVARQMRPHQNVRMMTLPSRGRATGSRSAADVSVTAGTPVLSPVSGRVVEVQHYALYGRYRDVRIRIVPSDNSRTVVTVLHVTGPRVRVGDRVEAGRTVIASRATKFPFTSQIDRFAGPLPHVHIELRRR